MTESVQVPEGTSHRGVVIAAVATVIAAIIVSAGTIIAASRNRESLEEKIAQLEKRLGAAAEERDAAKAQAAQLQEQLSRRRIEPPVTDTQPPAVAEKAARPTAILGTVSFKGFDVAFTGCVKDGGSVACYFAVKNNEAEREVTLLAANTRTYCSRAVDDARRPLLAENAEFGGQEGRLPDPRIPSETTFDGTLFFNVPASSRTFTVLQIWFSYEYKEYKAEFRNVSLQAPG
jgi:hypothetical protein